MQAGSWTSYAAKWYKTVNYICVLNLLDSLTCDANQLWLQIYCNPFRKIRDRGETEHFQFSKRKNRMAPIR